MVKIKKIIDKPKNKHVIHVLFVKGLTPNVKHVLTIQIGLKLKQLQPGKVII
jgi:hypothetical protein